jgi:hypothetical protein
MFLFCLFLGALLSYLKNFIGTTSHLNPDACKLVIFVPGFMSASWYNVQFVRSQVADGVSVHAIKANNYQYDSLLQQQKRFHAEVESILALHDNLKEFVIVGSSLGGVIARYPKPFTMTPTAVYTLGSPHKGVKPDRMSDWLVWLIPGAQSLYHTMTHIETADLLPLNETFVTISAESDHRVPAWSSHKEGGIKVAPMYWWHAYWYRWQHSALSFHPTVQEIIRKTK